MLKKWMRRERRMNRTGRISRQAAEVSEGEGCGLGAQSDRWVRAWRRWRARRSPIGEADRRTLLAVEPGPDRLADAAEVMRS